MTLDIQEKEAREGLRLLYGIAEKPYFEMTQAEKEEVAIKGFEKAKEASFTRGLPIIYGENGHVIAEYVDGRRFIRENGVDVKPYDGN